MTLIVLFVVLLVERFFDWSHLRYYGWYNSYTEMILTKLKQQSPYLILATLIIPAIIVLLLADLAFSHVLYGSVTLVIHVLVLLYCMGPQNLWLDAYMGVNSLTQDDVLIAADKLKLGFNIHQANPELSQLHRLLLENFFIASNARIFAPITLYLIFGLAGPIFYRLLTLITANLNLSQTNPQIVQEAQWLLEVSNWLPIRALTFLFALSGNFMQVFVTWCQLVLTGIHKNTELLVDCGFKALSSDAHDKLPEDGSAGKNAISLFDRTMIIVLVIVALVTMAL